MGLYPAAVKRLIPPGPNDPPIKPRVAILHVAATEATSLHDYFNGPSGGVESHFYVLRDGTVEQYRDTSWQADANVMANGFAVSIETQGLAAGEWTPQQLAAIKALLTWLNKAHGIPLVKCPRWDGAGVGYHILFEAQWDQRGAACPGPDRIKQFNNVLVPWMASGDTPAKDWFDMATPDDLRAAVKAELNSPDFLKNVARFVMTGFAAGPAGSERVLVGHLTQLDALSRVAIKAASEDLTPEQVKQAVSEALNADYDAQVVLTPKAG